MVQPIVAHTTYIAIGIIAMMMIITSLYGFKANMEKADATLKLTQVVDNIQSDVIAVKTIGGEAKVKIDGDDKILVKLVNNLITASGYGVTVNRTINMQMSGEEYLPANLTFSNNKVTIE